MEYSQIPPNEFWYLKLTPVSVVMVDPSPPVITLVGDALGIGVLPPYVGVAVEVFFLITVK
jgi:hypothetical protein